jgi:hypothetical protein
MHLDPIHTPVRKGEASWYANGSLIFIWQLLYISGVLTLCFVAVVQSFVWDACKDLTLIILMVAAAVSLALGIATEVCIASLVLLLRLYRPSIISCYV